MKAVAEPSIDELVARDIQKVAALHDHRHRTMCRNICATKGEPACWELDGHGGSDYSPCDTCEAAVWLAELWIKDSRPSLPDRG